MATRRSKLKDWKEIKPTDFKTKKRQTKSEKMKEIHDNHDAVKRWKHVNELRY